MVCPKCGFESEGSMAECPRCGLILSKYKERASKGTQQVPVPPVEVSESSPVVGDHDSLIGRLLFEVPVRVDAVAFTGRSLVFAVFALWSLAFVFSSVNDPGFGSGFWHLVNLPFHEAGHILYRPFGRLVTSLGGTLGQLLMPLVCMGVFLVKTRDTFAAAFCLWWLGQNFIDIAPYIDDARRLTMPLLGGNTGRTSPYGFHDWEFILTETGLLRWDHGLARFSHGLGTVLILLALAWWIYLLYIHYHRLER
jgi:hypothetical protein